MRLKSAAAGGVSHPRCRDLRPGRLLHLRTRRQVRYVAEEAEHAQSVTVLHCKKGVGKGWAHWLPSALPALGAGLEHLKGAGTMFLVLPRSSESQTET